jgi:hypothetical protein
MLEAEVINALQQIGVEPYVNHLFFLFGALHIMSIHDTYDMYLAFHVCEKLALTSQIGARGRSAPAVHDEDLRRDPAAGRDGHRLVCSLKIPGTRDACQAYKVTDKLNSFPTGRVSHLKGGRDGSLEQATLLAIPLVEAYLYPKGRPIKHLAA